MGEIFGGPGLMGCFANVKFAELGRKYFSGNFGASHMGRLVLKSKSLHQTLRSKHGKITPLVTIEMNIPGLL